MHRMLSLLTDMLRAHVPATWKLTLEEESRASGGESRVDARLTLSAPDGTTGVIAIDVKLKTYISPADIKLLERDELWTSGRYGAALILAPYLSPRVRTLLAEAHLNYADATGNLLLRLDRPALYVERAGAQENPWYQHQSLRSLKGPTAGRAVRAICDFRPPFGIRELAGKSQTPMAVISRVAQLLEHETLIERNDRGTILAVSVAQVIERWTRDYSLTRSNRVETCLEPRGIDALVEKIRMADEEYTLTGSLAAVRLAPFAAPRLASIYVHDIERAKGNLRVRGVERGANVLLIEPFDSVVFERSMHEAGMMYAAPTQVAADLLTSPGRSPEEGQELLRWMEGHRDAWQW